MSERFFKLPTSRRFASSLVVAFVLSASLVAAACSEKLDGGASCPSLCPAEIASFRDTTFEAVVIDTSISGFPTLGLAENLLLANRKDTVETRSVIRFDVLPSNFNPNKGTDTASITAIDSVYLLVVVDSTAVKGSTPVTLEAFDVDTIQDDTVTSVVKSLFRADRKIGSLVLTPSIVRDTLRIPLSKEFVLGRIKASGHVRVGLKFAGSTSAQLKFLAFISGIGAPQLSFDETTDTLYTPVHVTPATTVADADGETLLSYTVYTITDKGTPAPPSQSLTIGGWPARRTYFRFTVPAHILDSSTIVRAELLLTQRKSSGVDPTDSITVQPLIGTASSKVTDLRRAAELVAEGSFSALDSLRLAPGDTGLRVFSIVNLVRSWRSLSADVPPVLILKSTSEGERASELVFYSTKALPNQRPRLRITYLPRSEFAIP